MLNTFVIAAVVVLKCQVAHQGPTYSPLARIFVLFNFSLLKCKSYFPYTVYWQHFIE